MFKKIRVSKQTLAYLIFFLVIILPFIISIKPIIGGHIAFWYDPARDLLLAWDNLRKPTLIGPPTGIPGIFYGPYWIWILSMGLLVSKDPRVVVFVTQMMPYFIIMPYILYRLSSAVFNRRISVILWLLFIFAFSSYSFQIWNPHLAPLIFLMYVYVFTSTDLTLVKLKKSHKFFLSGILLGLLLNFHLSFGTAILLASVLHLVLTLILQLVKKKHDLLLSLRNWFIAQGLFFTGLVIALSPILLFEYRHGFNQIKAFMYTFSSH